MAELNSIGGLHYEMMRRCYNEKCVAYKDYGEKGIKVCEEWHDRENFRKWALENGYKKGVRLQRIDGSKDYEPDNCFFGTAYKRDEKSGSQNQKAYHRERMNKKAGCGIIGEISKDELYKTYYAMHTRCENKNHMYYKHYGGRGIKVCDEWSGRYGFFNFKKWANEQERKEGDTLDRIDVNGNYCPENCRFSDARTQMMNRRIARNYLYNGEIMNLAEISRRTEIRYDILRKTASDYELKKGDSIDFLIEILSKS